MTGILLQPNVRLASPASNVACLPVGALRRRQEVAPDNSVVESPGLVVRTVSHGRSQATFHGGEGIPGEELHSLTCLARDVAHWWGNSRGRTDAGQFDVKRESSKTDVWLNNWHRLAWLDLRPGSWAGKIKRRPGLASTLIEEPSVFAAHHSRVYVELCSQLCEVGRIAEAVDVLRTMVQGGCHVHDKLFYRVLKGCMATKDLVLCSRIHALTIQAGYGGNAFLATHLIGLYASHGKVGEAMGVFSKVSAPSIYNWAAIIFASSGGGQPTRGIQLYRQMLESSVKPDNRVFVAVLKACASAGDLVAGKEVHAHVLASPEKPDIFVQTGLLDMYSKCGSVEDARRVFDSLPHKDVVAWTAMIAGYGKQGMGQEALHLYEGMQQEGLSPPNCVTFLCLLQACAMVGVGALDQGQRLHTQIRERGLQDDVILGCSLVNMYAKCGSLEDAHKLFVKLPERDVVTWTAMIAGYAQQGFGHPALELYNRMQQEGLSPPDACTFVCLLQACATVSCLSLGKQLHAQIEERGMLADVAVGSSLVNMYAKCGSMSDSQRVFDVLAERSIDAWNALISGYTRQGNSEVVFNLLDRMRREGAQPNAVTFLSVLTACSHVGLITQGLMYFEVMRKDYGIDPSVDHYTCLIDLLGRAGHLDEALRMATTMPCQPNRSVWHTLLGACRKWNNVCIGQQALEFAVRSDGNDAASYGLMSNIYARAHMWEEAKKMQAERMKRQASKEPGQCWWTDVGGAVHTFVVGDLKHADLRD